jgi:Tetracyclin repressor-like, C-terminal domain
VLKHRYTAGFGAPSRRQTAAATECGSTLLAWGQLAAAHAARLRAALAGAVLMGIVSQRYILKMPDVKDADVEDRRH